MGALAGVGAGLSILGSMGSTVANVQAAKGQAAGLEYEARTIEEQAKFDETQNRRQHRIAQGQANAMAAASGLDISSGSPLLLELDRARQAELDAQSIRRQGAVNAESRRYGARLAKQSIPWSILGGAARGGSILSTYMAGRT